MFAPITVHNWEFASISNTEVVSVLFNNTMEKLSEVTLDANKAESSIRYITYLLF